MPYTADIFTNFATSTIRGGAGGAGTPLNPTDTTLLLATGDGVKFPQPAAGTTFRVLIGTTDIAKVTGRSTDTLTIVRANSLPATDPDFNASTPPTWPVGTTVQEVYSAASATDPWTAINSGRWYNVRDNTYGAKGDGVTLDGTAIRSALSAIQAAGGGTLYLPAGTYLCDLGANAENNTYLAIGFVPGNTRVVGDGIGNTVIKLANSQAACHLFMNWHIQSGGDENITFENLTLDGNAQNQSLAAGTSDMGLKVLRMRNLRCKHVRFKDVFGQASSGGGEGFHTTFDLSTDAEYIACECVGTTANTATGFSANQSSHVSYVGCIGRGMGVAHGFTHNTCVGLAYTNCYAYSNTLYGFNSESSQYVRYNSCRAGGLAVAASSYPYTSGQSLGNGSRGFVWNASTSVTAIHCESTHNGLHGLDNIVGTGTGVNIWQGGELSNNGGFGINNGAGDTLKIQGGPIMGGNTSGDIHSGSVNHSAYGNAAAPAVPATTVAITNPFCKPMLVWVTGTVTNISIDGSQVAGAPGTFYLRPAGTIALTYTGTPAWAWTSAL